MAAFQDFDVISERRRNEKKQKMRKMILIGVISTILLVGIIGAAVAVAVLKFDVFHEKKSASPSPTPNNNNNKVAHSEKVVKVVCSTADYKDKCEGPLAEAMKKDPKLTSPKDLLKVYVQYAMDEVDKAFNKTEEFHFESEAEKGAFEDCKQLFVDAKEDMETTINELTRITDIKKIATKSPDLNSWLSAVISYQQTCVDGFPEGKLKTDLQELFKDSKEFVSNSLAIVSQASSLLSSFSSLTGGRMLKEETVSAPHFPMVDGVPSWVSPADRRLLKAADNKPTPNVTVAKDGSGDFKTISEALAAMPKTYKGRYVVYVKEGIYDETVTIDKQMQNITLYGEGSQKSIITGNKNFRDGVRTFQTASFVVLGENFIGKAMGFRNTAGPDGHQAVAARVQADQAVFVNCRFEGYQDTLYVQTHRQFYRSCIISGTIDFIFGDAAVVFQNCIMLVRKPMDNQGNMVTAQGRMDKKQTTGIVLQKCTIKAEPDLLATNGKIKSYLGRPWKEFSRTIVMESEIGDFIDPAGWTPWAGDFALNTLYYAEYANTGPGAKTDGRVKWAGYKVINKEEASKFTVGAFLKGGWVQGTGVPAIQGLYN